MEGIRKSMLEIIFNYFIFPGFLFLSISGMIVSWIDRKVTARVQWRVGPPLLQPFYDIRKLFVKETILPANGNIPLFVISPVISVLSIVLVSNILILTCMNPSKSFVGDIIVILYLMTIPATAVILGASASSNPLASIGASREIKMILSYELPFVLSLLVPIIKSKSLLLGEIITTQQSSGSFAGSISGIIALIVAILCIQAKMGLVPFDLGEAETELAGGGHIEYSGPLLALWKLSKMMLLVVGPLFLVLTLWGKGSTLIIVLKYIALLVIAVLIRNTNPRVRIDHAMRFFWGPVTILGTIGLLLAYLGY